jgi:predicted alpha/beta-fold hydrolase
MGLRWAHHDMIAASWHGFPSTPDYWNKVTQKPLLSGILHECLVTINSNKKHSFDKKKIVDTFQKCENPMFIKCYK